MRTNIAKGVNRMIRNVVINHRDSFECQVFRKIVNRNDEPLSGGMPTIGGMGVLNADDEEDISWEFVGNGYALKTDDHQPSPMMDRRDAHNSATSELRFLVEPKEPSGMPESFITKKHDVIYIVISDDVKLAFEIVDLESMTDIPPFSTRYVTNRRADLDISS